MYLEKDDVEKFLKQSGHYSKKFVEELYEKAKKQQKKIEIILVQEKLATPNSLVLFYSSLINIPFIDLSKQDISIQTLKFVPEPLARRKRVISFAKTPKVLKIAMEDPEDLQTIDFIQKKVQMPIKVYLTTTNNITKILEKYHQEVKQKLEKMMAAENIIPGTISKDLKQAAKEIPIVKIVDTIFEYAIHARASDIHIEPTEDGVIVRNRIDGILHDVITLPNKTKSGIVARIKILANLKIDEHRLPQDGRFKIEQNEFKFSIRVSVLPVTEGEKVVMRLLEESEEIMSLDELGMRDTALEIIKRNIKRPHGMILSTGPTGSGKTTTLYSILNVLNKKGVNITTIEDPVEYRLPRINQSQVRPKLGFKFATGLRSILRQDPDIIMVGEIRDTETADISIRSAMTGHLVLSTLHTNNAAGALPRLIDMQIKPFLLASTVNVIIAQRLVRRICKDCVSSYDIDIRSFQELLKDYNQEHIFELLHIGKKYHGRIDKTITFYKGAGCDRCNHTGYKGRVGIYEVLEVTKHIQDLIMNKSTSEEIEKEAVKQGMVTMFTDGILKAKVGTTTINEIVRVTKE